MLWVLLLLLPVVDARCLFLHPSDLVPRNLVYGTHAGLDDSGAFQSAVLFDWSKASRYHTYRVLEVTPAYAATNATLGATNDAHEATTPLAIFRRVPGEVLGDDVIDNAERFHISVQVFSDCNPVKPITQATYFIRLNATYVFTHNYTAAHAFISSGGWVPQTQLVMHPDVFRHVNYTQIVETSSFLSYPPLHLNISLTLTNNGSVCADYGAENRGKICVGHAHFRLHHPEALVIRPFVLQFYMAQFAQMTAYEYHPMGLPTDFDVTSSVSDENFTRYDVCGGTIISDGSVHTLLRTNANGSIAYNITEDTIEADCFYRVNLFGSNSPFAHVAAWAVGEYVNESSNASFLSQSLLLH